MTPREKPILFSREMRVAILEGRKTQTRRVVKNPGYSAEVWDAAVPYKWRIRSPWEEVDTLWVKEGLFMPRREATLFLEVINVRVEHLQEITEADAVAEGCPDIASFRLLWDKLNTKRGYPWRSNPWVWRIDFQIRTAPETPKLGGV